MVNVFEHTFEHFKQYYIFFHTFFHPNVYKKQSNKITQTPLSNTPLQREEIYTYFCWPFNVRRSKSHQVNKMRSKWEGICIKCILYYFFLPIFLLIWEDKKNGSRRKNFLPYFLSFLFSFLNQIVENSIFHPISHPIFTPTKHILN